jgi:hypothetical protein
MEMILPPMILPWYPNGNDSVASGSAMALQ